MNPQRMYCLKNETESRRTNVGIGEKIEQNNWKT